MTNEVYNSQNKDIFVDEATHKLVVKKTQDTTNILEQNKIARNHTQQKGEFQRIAQIPLIALQIKTKQLFGHSNWHQLHKETQRELIKNMVNSNEFQNFRVGEKRL
jgi:hypothetical protein|tara:strand:- start:1027 stop:1344 length:318 start_codon:yes stop_codon:yes gene_type:complete